MKKLENSILRDIGTLSRAIHYLNDKSFRELALQKGQFVYLTRVCENEGISFKKLSELLKVDKTSTTKTIGKLIYAGFITKRQDEVDRREYQLYSTEAGRQAYDAIIDKENNDIEICFRGMSIADIRRIGTALKTMSGNYEAQWIENKRGTIT